MSQANSGNSGPTNFPPPSGQPVAGGRPPVPNPLPSGAPPPVPWANAGSAWAHSARPSWQPVTGARPVGRQNPAYPPPAAGRPVFPPPTGQTPVLPPTAATLRPVPPPPAAPTPAAFPPPRTAPIQPVGQPPTAVPPRPGALTQATYPTTPTHAVRPPVPPAFPPPPAVRPLAGPPPAGLGPGRTTAFPPPTGRPASTAPGPAGPTQPSRAPGPAAFGPPRPGYANVAPAAIWNQPPYRPAPPAYPPPAAGYPGYPNYPSYPSYPGYPGYAPSSAWAAPAYPGAWAPPKPAASSRLAIVVVLVALLVVGPIIVALIRSLTAPPQPLPTPPPTTQITIEPTGTTNPTNPPTTTTPGSTVYTPGPPDLNPNHPPMPSPAQIDSLLTSNPFYSQETSPTQCDIGTIDLANAPADQIESYLNNFVDCLMAVWYPTVVQAGFQLPHPSVTVYTHEIHSPCGTLDTGNAVYCSADQQIYYAADLVDYLPANFANTRFVGEAIIAHEFGHALQYRTMILASEGRKEETAPTVAEQMEWSRRTELQADCFAGVFFHSVAASTGLTAQDEANITALFQSLGGAVPNSDDHGTGTNRGYWVDQGLASSSPGVCSTYTAPASEVS